MNSLRKEESKMTDVHRLSHKMFSSVPEHDAWIEQTTVTQKGTSQKQMDDVKNLLWRGYCIALLRFDLERHVVVSRNAESKEATKQRRYYISTEKRRMFKRLMCLQRFLNDPVTVVDVASTLMISHKAASDIIKDSIGFDTINESIVEGRKRYMAKEWWVDTFMRNGASWTYQNGEEMIRSRQLYNLFLRENEQNKVTNNYNLCSVLGE